MAMFGKSVPKDGPPINQVKSMRGQGIDNNKIIQTLQRDGYTSSQIFEAMNQVDVPEPAPNQESNQPPEAFQRETLSPDDLQAPSQPEEPNSTPSSPNQSFSRPSDMPDDFPSNMPQGGDVEAQTEELIESIIEEKWEDIAKDIQKVVDWKNTTESKINDMQNDIKGLKENFDRLHKSIVGKIGDYDKNIQNVGADLKAVEQVFSKILPQFTQKVNELSDAVDKVKKNK